MVRGGEIRELQAGGERERAEAAPGAGKRPERDAAGAGPLSEQAHEPRADIGDLPVAVAASAASRSKRASTCARNVSGSSAPDARYAWANSAATAWASFSVEPCAPPSELSPRAIAARNRRTVAPGASVHVVPMSSAP